MTKIGNHYWRHTCELRYKWERPKKKETQKKGLKE
jgi:hypothetical protein